MTTPADDRHQEGADPDPTDRQRRTGPPSAEEPAADGAAPGPLPEDVAALGYEQARDELADLVRRLESGAAPLEESLALWERGELLARRCDQVLAGALARLDAVQRDSG